MPNIKKNNKSRVGKQMKRPDRTRRGVCIRDYLFSSSSCLCGRRWASFPRLPPASTYQERDPEVLSFSSQGCSRSSQPGKSLWPSMLPNRTSVHQIKVWILHVSDLVLGSGVSKYSRKEFAGFGVPLDWGSGSKGGVENDSQVFCLSNL